MDTTTVPQAHMMKLLSGQPLDDTYSENYIEIKKKDIFIIILLAILRSLLGNILLEHEDLRRA
jgi:hypothetical protein